MVMKRDPRSEELENLRVALVTFALQMDAFELRIKTLLPKKTAVYSAPPDANLARKVVFAMRSADCPHDGFKVTPHAQS